jgi:NADH dehydrogenase
MQTQKICILGGTGFVGKHLAIKLADAGHSVKIISRHPQRYRELLVVENVEVVQGNPFNGDDLDRELAGMDVAVNLIGILNESAHDGSGFEAAHVDLPARLVAVCKRIGVPRLLHMSACNAGVLRSEAAYQDKKNRGSDYLRTKGEGERKVLDASGDDLAVTIFRPSLIFGRGDGIFGRFASILTVAPVLPLACPTARFAPVFVGDVTEAFLRALGDPDSVGKTYDLCGPRNYSLKQLVEYTAAMMGIKRIIWGLSPTLSRWQGNIFEYIPGKLFSQDNYRTLQSDSVPRMGYEFPFGIEPTSVESVVPTFFGNKPSRNRYMALRARARR